MSTQKELCGTFLGERRVFENDDGSRVIIGELRCADGSVETVKGPASERELTQGLQFRMWGSWTTHPKFGRQFSFQNFVIESPMGRSAIVTYLSTQVRGIGSATATRIYDAFGGDSLAVLRDDPLKVAAAIKGITKKKAQEASERLRQMHGTERATAELLSVIHGRGFPRGVVAECLKRWGSKSADVIRRNPYHLLRFKGCGFLRVDQLYCDLGLFAGSLKRQALCGHDALRRDGNGDTWQSVNAIRDALAQKISGAAPDVERTLTLSARGGLLEIHHDTEGRWVADARNAAAEARLAEYVTRIVTDDRIPDWPSPTSLDVSEHQLTKIGAAFMGRLGILAGRPGCGKTYVTARVIATLLSFGYRVTDIAVAAPTGKAAQRITQSLAATGVTIEAKTIHSTLGVMASDGGSWFFSHGEGNPLDCKFLFVDESSMLDTNLAAQLFAAVGPETNVLLIGDVNQLPPVGHGAPLRDLIAAGVPSGELTEIRRNSGRIVSCCCEIVERRKFESSPKADVGSGENLPHIEEREDQPTDIAALITHLATKYDVDPLSGVQVLVATNRLRKSLNQKLQEALNPFGAECDGTPFRVGDKVINLKNGAFELDDSTCLNHGPAIDGFSDADGPIQVPVANGEQGIVLSVSPGRMRVRLDSRDITINVRWRREKGEDDEESGPGCSWDLAYAISVHKSQGSEWPIAIVIVDAAGGRIQTRQLLYTAISRAKLLCVTVGKRSLLEQAVRRDGARRKTFLTEKVIDGVQSIRRRQLAEVVERETDWSALLEGVA